MPYPLIIASNGETIARVNHDRTWSVRWDRVTDIAYEPPQLRRLALRSYATLLLVAKDNFFPTPWALSQQAVDEWTHFEAVIDAVESDPAPDSLLSTVSINSEIVARVNYDGSWSVRWDQVIDVARWTSKTHHATALIGICQIFRAAQDRFYTMPWEVPDDEED